MPSPSSDALPPGAGTFAHLVAARAEDDRAALHFEGRTWTWREVVVESHRRAALAEVHLVGRDRRHVGVLLENTPEHLFWWCGAALAGMTVIGINPTRRGADLARDITFTDCSLVVVDAARRDLLDGLDLGGAVILDVDAEEYAAQLTEAVATLGARPSVVRPDTTLSLIFTSGTTSAPKAVRCTQGRMARIAEQQVERRSLSAEDTFYVVMPMFHSNALMAGIAPAVAAGGAIVLRRRFSASAWLDDVRRHGVTFFNYVGKPLHYILATPEREDDADNPLRIAFGNEASERDIARFAARFDCQVIDSFGSSEGEIRIIRTPDTPPGSLGVAPEGTIVVDPETLEECPRAELDAAGRVTNAETATGEIVNTVGAELFEGYYRNPEAEQARLRHGWVWSGDLAYRDAAGFWYFAGRNGDWLRVDGENLAAAPVERLLMRYADFAAVAVVAAPDEVTGDQVLAVVELEAGVTFDPDAFAAFLAAQPDLGTKWAPRYVQVVAELPRTPTNKILKRALPPLSDSSQVWLRSGTTYVESRPPGR